jgi:hypothetical protein
MRVWSSAGERRIEHMYATVRRYQLGAGSRGEGAIREVVHRCDEKLVPVISGVEGFAGYYVVDAGDGIIATISIFDHQAAAEEGNKVAQGFWKENLSGLLQANPQVTSGRALVHKP